MKGYGEAKAETVHFAEPVCGIDLKEAQTKDLAEVICKYAVEGKLTMRTIMDALEIVRHKFENDAVI